MNEELNYYDKVSLLRSKWFMEILSIFEEGELLRMKDINLRVKHKYDNSVYTAICGMVKTLTLMEYLEKDNILDKGYIGVYSLTKKGARVSKMLISTIEYV